VEMWWRLELYNIYQLVNAQNRVGCQVSGENFSRDTEYVREEGEGKVSEPGAGHLSPQHPFITPPPMSFPRK